jgi:hypothetical protein
MPRGGFGRRFGRGFGGRRFGAPLIMPMGGWGMGGSPLLTTLMAGGLGYMMGSNTNQQQEPPPYQPYPYQGPPAAPPVPTASPDSGKLAQLQLLGQLHDSGTLTDDEFESEKQRILRSS